MQNKRVVVTGGAGFIGSRLASTLADENSCVVIDDLSTGRIENIASDIASGRLEFIQGSILDLDLLKRTFNNAHYVFHQAAMVSVPRSLKEPVRCATVNIVGTLNVLLAARECGVRKVVSASSSSVYGDTPQLPKREDARPNPLSPYAASKLAGEQYCEVFTRSLGLGTACLRYFNAYGPGQDPNSQYAAVIPAFMKGVLRDEGLIIFGDGTQTRDFTFVADVVEANMLLAESDATGVFNVGSGQRITINELAHLIMKIAGKTLPLLHQDKRHGDVQHSLADISRASSIGYRPRYDIEKGLLRSLAYYTEWIQAHEASAAPSACEKESGA